MLANAIVVVHLLIVLFVLAGVPLVYVGVALHWAWVRRRLWRLLHRRHFVHSCRITPGDRLSLDSMGVRPARPAIYSGLHRALGRWDLVLRRTAVGVYRLLCGIRRAGSRHLDPSSTDGVRARNCNSAQRPLVTHMAGARIVHRTSPGMK